MFNFSIQTALNAFFDEINTSKAEADNSRASANPNQSLFSINSRSSAKAPSNTPVTPPNVDFLEKAFSQLNSSFQENPTFSLNNSNSRNYQQSNINNVDINSISEMCLNQNQRQLPFTDAEYAASARFNYYNN